MEHLAAFAWDVMHLGRVIAQNVRMAVVLGWVIAQSGWVIAQSRWVIAQLTWVATVNVRMTMINVWVA
eukprot:6819619-Alexandrium_andersonii.AAC.1